MASRMDLTRLWNVEVDAERAGRARWVPATITICVTLYIATELLLLPPDPSFLSLATFRSLGEVHGWQPAVWMVALIVTFVVRLRVSVVGYFIGGDPADRRIFRQNLMVYAPAAGLHLLIIVLGLGVVTLFGLGASAFGIIGAGGFYGAIVTWIDHHVPTLVELPAMPWALLFGWTLYSFTSWFVHWLGHRSRFLWHVCHAPHHMPEFLHPLGVPLGFGFDFLVWLPRTLCTAILTKLFATEPLLFESGIVALLAYCLEIFNHSSAHYDTARRSPALHFLANLFGGHGAYHYLHHSSAREHQMANLGGGAFLLWDRLFGTFAEPPLERPVIGLTGNPEIYLNPLRVVFGGLARIAYEWRANSSWRTRLLILFGPIEYMPPLTRDFVKKPLATRTSAK